ncbi:MULTISPECIES: hypothetical protein [unclassified Microcoleus]
MGNGKFFDAFRLSPSPLMKQGITKLRRGGGVGDRTPAAGARL